MSDKPLPVNRRDVCTTTSQRVPNAMDVWNTLASCCTNVAGSMGSILQGKLLYQGQILSVRSWPIVRWVGKLKIKQLLALKVYSFTLITIMTRRRTSAITQWAFSAKMTSSYKNSLKVGLCQMQGCTKGKNALKQKCPKSKTISKSSKANSTIYRQEYR